MVARTWPPPERLHLFTLASRMREARELVLTQRKNPGPRSELREAHQQLLTAMEAYAAALTRLGIPIPRLIRDDLRLLRRLGW